ncbi:MAG: PleD family two-component system response regulator [Anaerolineales bacterium]
MLVDDDKAMTSLLKRMLEMESADFDVHILPTAEKALERFPEIQPDLFMIDYNLKDMNGLDLAHRLRADPAHQATPIVMASGMDMEQEALAAGVDVFLHKPFEPGDLAQLFLDLLGR